MKRAFLLLALSLPAFLHAQFVSTGPGAARTRRLSMCGVTGHHAQRTIAGHRPAL
jgi:hypothetical protein